MILVTGATGNVGGHLVSQLCRAGTPVRALVRSEEKADALRGYDCDIAIGSYDDASSLHRALAGVDAVFLLSPGDEDLVQHELAVLSAVEKAHGEVRVVKLATAGVDGDASSPLLDQHRQVIKALPDSATVLAPTVFMQELLGFAASVQERSALPVADATISYVDARDVAAVAAHVLTSEGHGGRTYTVTGPAAVSAPEVAKALTDLLGREVKVDASADQVVLDGATAVVTDEVEKATGRPARTLAEFLAEHAGAFR